MAEEQTAPEEGTTPAPAAEATSTAPTPEQTTATPTEQVEAPAEQAEATPPSLDKYFTAFQERGSLSDDEYTELATLGLSRDIVDTYIAGRTTTLTDADQEALLADVGGKDGFDALAKWATANLTEAEITELNEALRFKQSARLAVRMLQSRMEAVEGRAPARALEGAQGAVPGSEVKPFASRAEMTKAMADPRYSGLRRDPEYVKEIIARVAASHF